MIIGKKVLFDHGIQKSNGTLVGFGIMSYEADNPRGAIRQCSSAIVMLDSGDLVEGHLYQVKILI
jgi:hypothetical protein